MNYILVAYGVDYVNMYICTHVIFKYNMYIIKIINLFLVNEDF